MNATISYMKNTRVQRKSFLQLVIQASGSQYFTGPDIISTSSKSFAISRIDFTVLLLFEFLKKHHLPVGEVKNRIHQPRQQNPLARGYRTLLSLHAEHALLSSNLVPRMLKIALGSYKIFWGRMCLSFRPVYLTYLCSFRYGFKYLFPYRKSCAKVVQMNSNKAVNHPLKLPITGHNNEVKYLQMNHFTVVIFQLFIHPFISFGSLQHINTTALMVQGQLVPLFITLFVHYFSNESSESLNELENHPNVFMLEFYNGAKGCVNIAFLRNRGIQNNVYCICQASI